MQIEAKTTESSETIQFNLSIHADDIFGADRSAGWTGV